MTASLDLRTIVAEARAIGARGEPTDHLTRASCALVLDSLDVDPSTSFDALVSPVLSSRNPLDDSLLAGASGRSWMISGHASHVPNALGARLLRTVVRSRPFAGRERGLRVYSIDADTPGVTITALETIDADGAGRIIYDAVQIGDERVVGPSRDATVALGAAFDCIVLVAVAEMLGAADAARRSAMRSVQSRVQFGEPLARRQAVAHRVADMTIACDAVSLMLADALASAIDNTHRPEPLAVASTKLAASVQLPLVTASAHQLHGGEGYYADQPMHRWHRRVSSLAMQFGDRRTMRARAAELLGLAPVF